MFTTYTTLYTINIYAILACGIASLVLGMLWYGPVFGKIWIKLMGFTEKQMEEAKKKGMSSSMIMAFIASCVMAFVLAQFLGLSGFDNINGAASAAFSIWLGFFATASLSPVLWEGKPWKLYFIGISHQLVQLLIFAAILVSWK